MSENKARILSDVLFSRNQPGAATVPSRREKYRTRGTRSARSYPLPRTLIWGREREGVQRALGVHHALTSPQVLFLRHENSRLARAFSCRRKRGSQLVRAPT